MPRAGLNTEAVLDAAMVLVDRNGVDQLTLAAVADHVGVRSPSLYRHVASLDDLHERLATRAVQELAGVLEEAVGDRTGPAALRAMMTAHRGWANDHPRRHALVPVRAPRVGTELAAASDRLVTLAVQWVEGFDLHDDEAIHAVRAVRAALHGFASIEAAGGFGLPADVDASFERLVDLVVTGLSGR